MRRPIRGAMAIVLAAAGMAKTTAAPGDWQDYIGFTLSERLRGEFVDWFRPPAGTAAPGAERYDFFASQLRGGLRATFPYAQLVVEVQDTRIANLPDDASLPPPAGNPGPGAIYFAHTRDTSQGKVFLKQVHVTLRHSGYAASVGPMEHSDGLERPGRSHPRMAQAVADSRTAGRAFRLQTEATAPARRAHHQDIDQVFGGVYALSVADRAQ